MHRIYIQYMRSMHIKIIAVYIHSTYRHVYSTHVYEVYMQCICRILFAHHRAYIYTGNIKCYAGSIHKSARIRPSANRAVRILSTYDRADRPHRLQQLLIALLSSGRMKFLRAIYNSVKSFALALNPARTISSPSSSSSRVFDALDHDVTLFALLCRGDTSQLATHHVTVINVYARASSREPRLYLCRNAFSPENYSLVLNCKAPHVAQKLLYKVSRKQF